MQVALLKADKEPSRRSLCLLGCLFFLALWALRLATLHPAFHPDDSPEITAAAAQLGIPHPPGYPLPTLLGRLAVRLLPGGPAFAVNALAAFWSCLAVLLALLLAARLLNLQQRVDRIWLLALALALATLPQLWFQGASSKGGIYTLNLCLTLAPLLLLQPTPVPTQNGPARLRLAWLLVGLGLANHYMSLILFLPTLAYWSWGRLPGLRSQLRLWLFALPGMALYLYLPLRAQQRPAMNWGDPSNFSRFMDVLLRRMYRGAESGQDLDNFIHLSRHFAELWQPQWGLPGAVLLLAGWSPLWRERETWRPLLLGLLLHLGVVLAYNHPPRDSPWVINAFFLPTFVLAAPLLLAGARRLAASLSGQESWAAGAAILLLLALAPARWRAHDFSRDYLLYDYAQDLLEKPVKGAVILGAGGNDAFPFWYSQQLEGRRPDLILVDVPLIGPWYLEQLRAQGLPLNPSWRDRDAVVQGLLEKPPRPLYYSSHNPGDRGIPLGLLSLVPAPGQTLTLSVQGLWGPWQAVRLRWVAHSAPLDGNRAELLGYYSASAEALARFGQSQGVTPLVLAGQRQAARFRATAAGTNR